MVYEKAVLQNCTIYSFSKKKTRLGGRYMGISANASVCLFRALYASAILQFATPMKHDKPHQVLRQS
jgi:hypothetical protein